MENYYSIGEASAKTGLTIETLRHYDRILLVKPAKKDPWTGYRYYSKDDIIRLNTIQALRCMDLSLKEIKTCLEYDNLKQVSAFLKQAEAKADKKMEKLLRAKEKIHLARQQYEQTAEHYEGPVNAYFLQQFEKRIIMISDTLKYPSLDVLWSYLRHFYGQIPEQDRKQYQFEDLAGIFLAKGKTRMFAVCSQYPEDARLRELPAGTYLCGECTEADRDQVLEKMLEKVERQTRKKPEYVLQMVMINGILQWKYQLQIYCGEYGDKKSRPTNQ